MEEAEGQALTGEDLAIKADGMGNQGEDADAAQDRRTGCLALPQTVKLIQGTAQIQRGGKEGSNQGSYTSLQMVINWCSSVARAVVMIKRLLHTHNPQCILRSRIASTRSRGLLGHGEFAVV